MATFNYVEKDGMLLDQKITEGLMTSALGVPGIDLVSGGKSFTLRTLTTSGFQAHTRNKGFNAGKVEDSKKVYSMGQDRDVEFYIDKQDVDETNQELAMGNISNVFITEHVQPELDAYRFSTLATKAAETATHSVQEDVDNKTIYSKLKAAILPLRKYGPQNIIGYVSSATMDALERSTEFTRSITNQNVGMTALESRVTSLDGVQLVEVWDESRFMTKYDFTDGYKATDDALAINYLFVVKPAVISVVKENAVYLFAPGEHTQGDGYLYQNHLYHDIFVKEQSKDGLFVSTAKAATPKPAEK